MRRRRVCSSLIPPLQYRRGSLGGGQSNTKLQAAIAGIGQDEWTAVRYPGAVYDEQLEQWISNAEVAETRYTAFETSIHKVTARLVIRRVKEQNPAPPGQAELFPLWRYHAFLTDTGLSTVQADQTHRDHAIVEQVFADLIDGPLAHLPSGRFAANAAWLTLAAMAHNLLRAAGCLISPRYSTARAATIRRQLINIPARIAHRARRVLLHLPAHWPWQQHWQTLFTTTHDPPLPDPATPTPQPEKAGTPGRSTAPTKHTINNSRSRTTRRPTAKIIGGSRLRLRAGCPAWSDTDSRRFARAAFSGRSLHSSPASRGPTSRFPGDREVGEQRPPLWPEPRRAAAATEATSLG